MPVSFNTAMSMNYLRMLTGHNFNGSGYAGIRVNQNIVERPYPCEDKQGWEKTDENVL